VDCHHQNPFTLETNRRSILSKKQKAAKIIKGDSVLVKILVHQAA